jgi:hypothetical protein
LTFALGGNLASFAALEIAIEANFSGLKIASSESAVVLLRSSFGAQVESFSDDASWLAGA